MHTLKLGPNKRLDKLEKSRKKCASLISVPLSPI